MFKRFISTVGALGVVAGALFLTPSFSPARGGGGGGGGRGGGGGGRMGGGGGGGRMGGGNFRGGNFRGGNFNRGGGGWGWGYGGWGWGYPYYGYGGNYYYGDNYVPNYYAPSPDYYGPSADYYAPAPVENMPYANTGPSGQTAVVIVDIPQPNAQLTVNGSPTRQRGTHREFETTPIERGQTYQVDMTATWMENGKKISSTKSVDVKVGERRTVSFGK